VRGLVVGVNMRLSDKFNSWLRILRFSVEDQHMKKIKFEFEFKLLYTTSWGRDLSHEEYIHP
jgi:hypothetical protein